MFEQNISCEDAKKMLQEQQAQLVDVRTPAEFSQGALPNAINLPLQTINQADNILEKDKPIILYCVTGTRTRMAKIQLNNFGFDQVHDLGSFQNYLSCHQ